MAAAGIRVDVRPGERLPVHYAPAYVMGAPARMGTEPVQRAGLGFSAVMSLAITPLLVIIVLLLLLLVAWS